MEDELKTLKDFETLTLTEKVVDAKENCLKGIWIKKEDLRQEAINQVKQINEWNTKANKHDWSWLREVPEEWTLEYFKPIELMPHLGTIRFFIMWQNNLTEEDLK